MQLHILCFLRMFLFHLYFHRILVLLSHLVHRPYVITLTRRSWSRSPLNQQVQQIVSSHIVSIPDQFRTEISAGTAFVSAPKTVSNWDAAPAPPVSSGPDSGSQLSVVMPEDARIRDLINLVARFVASDGDVFEKVHVCDMRTVCTVLDVS